MFAHFSLLFLSLVSIVLDDVSYHGLVVGKLDYDVYSNTVLINVTLSQIIIIGICVVLAKLQ